jgi:hypothetical protein
MSLIESSAGKARVNSQLVHADCASVLFEGGEKRRTDAAALGLRSHKECHEFAVVACRGADDDAAVYGDEAVAFRRQHAKSVRSKIGDQGFEAIRRIVPGVRFAHGPGDERRNGRGVLRVECANHEIANQWTSLRGRTGCVWQANANFGCDSNQMRA